MTRRRRPESCLPAAGSVLAVVAHPDDESFGLGAVLAAFANASASVGGVCFTRGEASTLGDPTVDLAHVRGAEQAAAARALGIDGVDLLDHPDGLLSDVTVAELADTVAAARRHHADLLVVFDDTGITGHPDHRHATRAAINAAAHLEVPVLTSTVTASVARSLNEDLGTAFVGRPPEEIDIVIPVDRARQLEAIRCHTSQSTSNPVLWRRLELTGGREHLRWLRRPT